MHKHPPLTADKERADALRFERDRRAGCLVCGEAHFSKWCPDCFYCKRCGPGCPECLPLRRRGR
jgi:hypothetical protein